ncbi:hypothetical protein, partial [Burkholderia gladioli]|uniref:hypothetical protein n=1 Tax=Burkholderia gladioli TaxID=28095 RepID=UPI001ABAA9F0
ELLQQLGGNRRQLGRHGFRFARHMFSLGQKYASNTKLRTGPSSSGVDRVGVGNSDRYVSTAFDPQQSFYQASLNGRDQGIAVIRQMESPAPSWLKRAFVEVTEGCF